MKTKITERDYIKAHRKASREEEIARHGRPLPKSRAHTSKRSYDRNKMKAALKKQPFDLQGVTALALGRNLIALSKL